MVGAIDAVAPVDLATDDRLVLANRNKRGNNDPSRLVLFSYHRSSFSRTSLSTIPTLNHTPPYTLTPPTVLSHTLLSLTHLCTLSSPPTPPTHHPQANVHCISSRQVNTLRKKRRFACRKRGRSSPDIRPDERRQS